MKKYYITTPIYYVNGLPHIGHAYTSVAADVIARSMRLSGYDVMFLTGTDEHGQKVEESATKNSMTPKEFTDKISMSFCNLANIMSISNDDFIRTTEERHIKTVEKVWQKLLDTGNIYLGEYAGWYSVRDEAFYDESELKEDGTAPTGAKVEWVSEPSYFFALSKWQDKLLEFYEQNQGFIKPLSKRNEVINFVKSGLRDLSISRTSFTWGIKVPNDSNHVIYVWLDALVNYISALGYPDDISGKYKKFWPCDVHIVGKDILRFHAVYWPAFLMAADIEPPKCVMAHGWWTNQGEKMSKSVGNVIDPLELIDKFGVDSVRYFLMREITFGSDGNYSSENLINRINSELANKIGNLMQRTMTLVHKHCDGKVPVIIDAEFEALYELPVLQFATKSVQENFQLVQNFEINSVLNNIIHLAELGNIYIDHHAPWKIVKIDAEKVKVIFYSLLEILRYIAIMLQPFTPKAADLMLNQLGIEPAQRDFKHLNKQNAIMQNIQLLPAQAIFPKITEV